MSNALSPQGSDIDIVTLVQTDHRTLRAQLTELMDTAPGARAASWPGVVHALAVHEVAEELVLFPAMRVVTNEHDAVLTARIEEQKSAERLLADMDDLDPSSEEFGQDLHRLHETVLAHAQAEERDVLPVLVHFGDALDRPTLGARYEEAKRRAPTHPHPEAPHRPPGNVLVGPVISLFDRMRDHMS